MLPLAHSQHNDCQLSSFMALIKWDCTHTHTQQANPKAAWTREATKCLFLSVVKTENLQLKLGPFANGVFVDSISSQNYLVQCIVLLRHLKAIADWIGCGMLAAHGTSFNMGFRWRFLFLCMCAALAPAPAPNRCPRKVVSFNSHHFLEMFTSDSFNRSDCLKNFVNFAVAQPLIATKPNDNEYPFILTPHSMQMHIHGRCRLISRAICRPKDTSTQ